MSSLDDFLQRHKRKRILADLEDMTGTFTCQNDECLEIVLNAKFDISTDTVVWYCSKNHESEIKL